MSAVFFDRLFLRGNKRKISAAFLQKPADPTGQFLTAYIIDVYIYLYMRKKLKYCNGKSVAFNVPFWYNNSDNGLEWGRAEKALFSGFVFLLKMTANPYVFSMFLSSFLTLIFR